MKTIAKAIVAGVVALLGALVIGYEDDTLTAKEIVTAISAGVVAFGTTYLVPNKDPEPLEVEATVRGPRGGLGI